MEVGERSEAAWQGREHWTPKTEPKFPSHFGLRSKPKIRNIATKAIKNKVLCCHVVLEIRFLFQVVNRNWQPIQDKEIVDGRKGSLVLGIIQQLELWAKLKIFSKPVFSFQSSVKQSSNIEHRTWMTNDHKPYHIPHTNTRVSHKPHAVCPMTYDLWPMPNPWSVIRVHDSYTIY